jgi:hypothetical protein
VNRLAEIMARFPNEWFGVSIRFDGSRRHFNVVGMTKQWRWTEEGEG